MLKFKTLSNPDINRILAIGICTAAVMVCLAYANFRDQLPNWWRWHGGGIPYVVFWITFWFVFFPFRRCLIPICLFAVSMTCFLEFAQLWKPDWLVQIRATRFGAALLGSGFVWSDFPPYLLGGIVGYCLLKIVIFAVSGPKSCGKK